MTDFLEKYHPTVSILDDYEVDKTDPDYAFNLYKKLLQAKRGHQLLFLVIGKLLREIRDEKLYLKLDYDTFSAFLASEEISYSTESAYMFMRIYEYYIEKLGLSEETVSGITLSKLSLMIPMIKSLDKEEAIDKIEELSALRHNDFMIRTKQLAGDDKPKVWYSKELDKWLVQFFSDRTHLVDQGIYSEFMEK